MANENSTIHKLSFEGNIAANWEKWKRAFDVMVVANEIADNKIKKFKMLHNGGMELQDIYYNLPQGAENEETRKENEFESMVKALDEYFIPKSSSALERKYFREMKQNFDETINQFVVRLRQQAAKCEFNNEREHVRDQIVYNSKHNQLERKVIEKGSMDLDELIKLAQGLEITELSDKQVQKVSVKAEKNHGQHPCRSDTKYPDAKGKTQNKYEMKSGKGKQNELSCFRCGRVGHLSRDKNCPALGKQCNRCKLFNHFNKVCKSRVGTNRVRYVKDSDEKNSSDNSEILKIIDSNSTSNGNVIVVCLVGNVKIGMTVDTGAAVNIISKDTYFKAKDRNIKVINEDSTIESKLKDYGGNDISVYKVIRAEIAYKEEKVEADIYVVKGSGTSLLSCKTAVSLKIISFDVKSIQKYESLNGTGNKIGKLKDVQVEIHIDESIIPVRQPYRRIPIPLREKVSNQLKELLDNDIIERVEGISEWISPLVVVPKNKNNDVRLCVDMRQANKAIKREVHPLPTFDDILPSLSMAVIFTKLDVKNAFHQIEITPRSRQITTFISHEGVYRFKRLMFGMTCASEIFQKTMENLLVGIKGIVIYIDDILIFAENCKEHDRILEEVLIKLKDNGITLNNEKCQYRKTEIIFMGHILNASGIRPTIDKVRDIRNFRQPNTKEEVRSFLGILNYIGRFVPDLATISEPLKILTRKGKQFEWTSEQENSFQKLKEIIAGETILGYYGSKDRTIVVADASPYGLGGVLMQEDDKGKARIIAFASKGLSDVEKRYSQTEKEALALVWAVERFKMYLMGKQFDLITDHKPLEVLFKPLSKPCPRIERWVLRLQSYDMNVIYRPGKTNIADPLSRLCQQNPVTYDERGEKYLNEIVRTATPKAITMDEIIEEVMKDEEISDLKCCLKYGKWPQQMSHYKRYSDDLSEVNGILLRFRRIVIPKSIQLRILELAHEGHPGESLMKRRLRTKTWWYNQDNDVTNYVKACNSCQVVSKRKSPEPLYITELPKGPWRQIRMDFLGPLPNKDFILVITDDYSRFVLVEIMKSCTSEKTIEILKPIFTRFGIPEILITDNGPQFTSHEFRQFCEIYGAKLKHTIPYSPSSNGEVERQNRSILKRLRIAQLEKKNYKDELNNYLLMYSNAIHQSTNASPAKLMFNRDLKEKIPYLANDSFVFDEDVRERDLEVKLKRKEYTDNKRGAVEGDIRIGDSVISQNERPENKLSSNYNPDQYVVMEKNGKAAVIQGTDGKCQLRRTDHLKKVIPMANTHKQRDDMSVIEKSNDSERSVRPEIIESTSIMRESVTMQEAQDQRPASNHEDGSRQLRRTSRIRRAPSFMKDFVN